jgi:hypothetical protein
LTRYTSGEHGSEPALGPLGVPSKMAGTVGQGLITSGRVFPPSRSTVKSSPRSSPAGFPARSRTGAIAARSSGGHSSAARAPSVRASPSGRARSVWAARINGSYFS